MSNAKNYSGVKTVFLYNYGDLHYLVANSYKKLFQLQRMAIKQKHTRYD